MILRANPLSLIEAVVFRDLNRTREHVYPSQYTYPWFCRWEGKAWDACVHYMALIYFFSLKETSAQGSRLYPITLTNWECPSLSGCCISTNVNQHLGAGLTRQSELGHRRESFKYANWVCYVVCKSACLGVSATSYRNFKIAD